MKHIKISPQRYRWVIVAASFLMVFVCLGFCSSSKSLYLAAITEALGIKRSLFSINDSCRYIATAVVNLFFGALCARFGRKRLIAAGFACLIASMLLYAYAPNIYLFYLGGVLLGLGLAWTTTTMVGSIVHRWCPAHAGKIMSLILAANGVGAAVATQIVTPIIYAPGDAFGYRSAFYASHEKASLTVCMRSPKAGIDFWQEFCIMEGKSAGARRRGGAGKLNMLHP